MKHGRVPDNRGFRHLPALDPVLPAKLLDTPAQRADDPVAEIAQPALALHGVLDTRDHVVAVLPLRIDK